jgi:hypothetical protein
MRHLDRKTGKLTDRFSCASPVAVVNLLVSVIWGPPCSNAPHRSRSRQSPLRADLAEMKFLSGCSH